MFCDLKGDFAISIAVIGLIVGAIIGGAIGGYIAYNEAVNSGCEGWKLIGYTALGIGIGGIVGGTLGYTGGWVFTKLTGILGLSIINGNVFIITDVIVLGHFSNYVTTANELGYGYYQISESIV